MEKIIEGYRNEMIATLRLWLRIPSVKADPLPGAPFGADVRDALNTALADCKRLGFKTVNYDGYIGRAEMGEGTDEDALAILAHLDVVPAGDGWIHPPFGAELDNDVIYARGVCDDKGPAVCALYAMKAVMDKGLPLRRKVILILGCDEESGWEDIRHYNEVAVMPRMGFSPDAGYPVINIEKGLCHLALSAKLPGDGLQIISIDAGERVNVIPGKASALLSGGDELIKKVEKLAETLPYPLTACREGDYVRLSTVGVPGHAAYPQAGRNAIGQLLLAMKALGAVGPIAALADKVGMEYDGKALGIKVSDEQSGELTCNLGILRVKDASLYATLDIRFPILISADALIESIRGRLPGIDVAVSSVKAPHYVDAESPLVTSLLDAYHEVTGLPKETIAIGGGTYARSLKEGVAFGAQLPDEPDLAHQAEERATLSHLYDNVRIFARAIEKLACK